MTLQRLGRGGSALDITILAVIALVLGAGCFATAAFPLDADTPRGLMTAFGAGSMSIAVALVLAGERATPMSLHAGVVLLSALRAVVVAVAATERGLMLAALGFVWTAVYVAFFFRADVARRYAALMTVALGVSMLAARAPTHIDVWITISAMIWVATALLTSLNARLRADAQSDGLTGLLNRTGFALAAARQRAMSKRRSEPITIAVIDLDSFKVVNDREGHAAGDRLLFELAAAWTSSLRPGDLLARFGGDEFVLLLPGVTEEQLETVLERLRRAHPASWTAGAVVCSDEESLDEAIHRADRHLYAAKQLASARCATPSSRVRPGSSAAHSRSV